MASKKVPRRLLYDNGLPFTAGAKKTEDGKLVHKDRLAYNLEKLAERVVMGKATLIIVDGSGLGEGKTTMSVHLADFYTKGDTVFEEQLYMGGEAFIKGLRVCFNKGHAVIVYDESGDFDKRGALSRLNKMLSRVFDVYRAFKIIVVLVLPNFLVLDESLFQKNIPRMLIHCEGRTSNQGNFSVYDLSRMLWIRERAKKCVIKNDAFRMVQPNFRGHFLNLPPDRSDELDRYSTGGKLDVIDVANIKSEGLLSFEELAAKLDRTHEWVRRKVSRAGFKPVKKYKGKSYFSEEVLRALKAERKERGRKR